MSTLEENVTKLKNAFTAIKTTLVDWGVAVPTGTKLSDVPALVDGISAGTPALCTFEITYSSGKKTIETTSKGAVRLRARVYDPDGGSEGSVTSVSMVISSSAVFDTSARDMFYYCVNLTSLTLPSGFGANITNANDMFGYCTSLTSLTLPEGFGASIADASGMFGHCTRLTQILAPEGVTLENDGSNGILRMKISFDLSSTALDKESLIRVIKSLQTVTSATLTLGTTLKAKLEGDDNADGAAALALATSKGWTIE